MGCLCPGKAITSTVVLEDADDGRDRRVIQNACILNFHGVPGCWSRFHAVCTLQLVSRNS